MSRRRRFSIAVVLLVMFAVFVAATWGPAPPTPRPPGTFSFAVLGDAPYYVWEEWQYRVVRQSMNDHDLSWILHVGDVFWLPCSDARYRQALDEFDGMRHPVVYTPGDNEWTDCWQPRPGGYAPLERLDRLREIFFADPEWSLGGRRLPLISQAGADPFSEFVENVRWTHENVVFATLHMVGSRNGREEFPARTAADDEASRRRTGAAVAWIRETFAEAKRTGASAVVLGFHANPGFEEPAGNEYRQAFEPFVEALEEEVEAFAGPVLMAHGDNHVYLVDHPLKRRTTGRVLENLTRLHVPGSPEVGWVRVVVTPGAENPFAFESRVIPGWKYW